MIGKKRKPTAKLVKKEVWLAQHIQTYQETAPIS